MACSLCGACGWRTNQPAVSSALVFLSGAAVHTSFVSYTTVLGNLNRNLTEPTLYLLCERVPPPEKSLMRCRISSGILQVS